MKDWQPGSFSETSMRRRLFWVAVIVVGAILFVLLYPELSPLTW